MGIVFPLGPWDGLVPAEDAHTWPHWIPSHLDHASDRILLTSFPDFYISTIHRGFDPRGDDQPGPPCLWETLILGGPFDRGEEVYPSRQDAVIHHLELLRACVTLRGATASATGHGRASPANRGEGDD